jgi:hypothetical protein
MRVPTIFGPPATLGCPDCVPYQNEKTPYALSG